ncbi:MAG: DinB family protein [Acidobacteria bacterium]|nr:DinB family protein [Acidobacteriota bacterium]
MENPIDRAVRRLAATGSAIQQICRDLTPDEARFRESGEKWSILEIVNHLLDEEILDFRARLQSTIFRPDVPWPRIDPPGWAIEKDYQSRDLAESLVSLAAERASSLEFLPTVSEDELATVHHHPTLGEITAGDLLHSWVAHDLLHLRQIARVRYRMLEADAAPYRAEYAGPLT